MYRTAVTDRAALAADEARMARAAASGDGTAFAALYERYEQRAFNLAYRITGSEADAADTVQAAFLDAMRRPPHLDGQELTFGRCLFTATRNAGHGLVRKQARSRPGEASLDPEQVDIGEASLRLPVRQREVLALHDLEELSYDEIGEILEVNGNTVAQLISRARINLCDEMRGTSLAAVAAPSAECERALPLIATRDDGQLEPASGDAAWLDDHLAGCRRCRAGVEAMQEADASYRSWAPIAAAPWLLRETMAKAAAEAGADWSEAIADAAAARTPAESQPAAPPAYLAETGGTNSSRRRAAVAAGLAALVSIVGVAAVFAGNDPSATTADSAAGAGLSVRAAAIGVGVPVKAGRTKAGAAGRKRTSAASGTTEVETVSTPVQALPSGGAPSEPASHPHTSDEAAVDPTEQAPDPTAGSKPKPAPATPAPQPTSTPAPEEAPAAEEASGKGPQGHEPAAKPIPLPVPVPIPKLAGHGPK